MPVIIFSILISPLLSLFLGLLNFYKSYKSEGNKYVIFSIGLFFGVLNSLKVLENDLEQYAIFYSNAGKYNFFDYLLLENKEYIFYSLNYILYYVFFGNFELYIILFTASCYYFLAVSLYQISKKLNLSVDEFWIGLLVLLFFPNIFSISAHLMRQFLAGSLVVYSIARIILGKSVFTTIAIIFFAGLVHSSALFFLIFPIIGALKNRKQQILAILLISFFLSVISIFQNILVSLPIIGYGFSRFFNRENTIWEADKLSLLSISVQLICLCFFFLGTVLKKKKMGREQILFYISLILSIFILSNYNNTEIAARFNFYFYQILPLSFLFFYDVLKIRGDTTKKIINIGLSILLILWFIYKIEFGTWTYEPLEKIFNLFL